MNNIIKKSRHSARVILNFFERTQRHVVWRWKEYNAKRQWLSTEEIAEYRKKIKVYDIFTFFNELDVLELRLNILDPYVDYFVLSEATETFSGIAKPLHFKDNIERFKKWEHKIIYCLVENVPKDEDELRAQINNPNLDEADRKIYTNALTSNNVGKDKDGRLIPAWFREFIIKEGVRKGLTNLRDDDICYISDLDEVWNPELVIDYSKDDVFKLIQIGYMYFLNNRSNEEDWNGWTGTVVTKYKNIKNVSSINHIRTHKIMKDTFIFLRNGGWHFAFQGGYEGAKRKIVESNHFWYKQEETLPNLDARVKNNQDYRGRGIKLWSDERGLPKFLLENKEKYKQFFR